MSKIVTTKINKWSGGIVDDPRDPSQGVCRVKTNFESRHVDRLIPYRSSESGDNAAATSEKQNFCIAHWLPGVINDHRLFSLGYKSGAGTAEVMFKKLTTGGTFDLGDNLWDQSSYSQSPAGLANFNLFVFYKRTGLIYGATAGTHIWAYDPTTGAAWDNANLAVAYTNIGQGIVHSKDDILYIPVDNKIIKNNNGAWTSPALTLPEGMVISTICEFGNYLAIGAYHISQTGNSIVYLWDRDSTLVEVDENIDWGYGVIRILVELDGYLVGVSAPSTGLGITHTLKNRVIFRYYTGAAAQTFLELTDTGSLGTFVPTMRQKIGNRVHFQMSITLNGSKREGIWSFGRNKDGQWTLIHERTPENDTAISGGQSMKGFFYVGDYLFQSYTNAALAFATSKTDDQANFNHSSIYETQINPNMPEEDKYNKKQLKAISVRYVALPTAGQVILKYKVDGGSYATIFTETTDNAVFTEMVSQGATAFTAGREYEFRLESTGGAEIVELIYTYEVLETNA